MNLKYSVKIMHDRGERKVATASEILESLHCSHSANFKLMVIKHEEARVELLVSHRAPPQVAERGRLTRYGGYWGNNIPRVDQNQHHCLVKKGDPQRLGLGGKTPTKNQPTQRLRWQPRR